MNEHGKGRHALARPRVRTTNPMRVRVCIKLRGKACRGARAPTQNAKVANRDDTFPLCDQVFCGNEHAYLQRQTLVPETYTQTCAHIHPHTSSGRGRLARCSRCGVRPTGGSTPSSGHASASWEITTGAFCASFLSCSAVSADCNAPP